MRLPVARQTAIAIAAVMLSGGCIVSKDSTGPSDSGIVTRIIGVQTTSGTTGTVHTGAVPAAQVAGPSANVASNISVINGGTSQVAVTSTGSMSRVIVAVQGVDGYWEVTLPSASSSVQLLLTLAQSVTGTTLPLRFAAANSSGQYGATTTSTATLTQVGTGDVQVSVSWDTPSDVDLHVVGPDNVEIYWAHTGSTTSGNLDLDSNAACAIDNVNNENVTWPTGSAPAGTYTVRLDYWANCTVAATNYVVTVKVAGRAAQVFTGQFTGAGDSGGAGSGRLITTFTK
jgi:hypothetical protein